MNSKYNVLILGSGAREHAFAWKINQSSRIDKLYVAPGNAGTSQIAINLSISVNDFISVKKAVLEKNIKMVVVGPEDPIVKGIVDFFNNDDELSQVMIIGPDSIGAQLEGSKSFAKQFMLKYNIPSAKYHIATNENVEAGVSFLSTFDPPYVLKADGLAAGKGVLILNSREEAESSLKEMLGGKFGDASKTVVIEQYLQGIEMSLFVLSDGINYVLLPEAKDYKRIGVGDTGLNTGGMGAVSPVPFVTPELMKKIEDLVVRRTVFGIRKENIKYKGFIFIGLMIDQGSPNVIEYNIRMGDPESEVVIPRIENDLLELLEATVNGTLIEQKVRISNSAYSTVIVASNGYPENYEKGKQISGLENKHDSLVFHAGTLQTENGVVSNGGRVLAVSSSGDNIKQCVEKSLKTIQEIHFDGMYYRNDIGYEFSN